MNKKRMKKISSEKKAKIVIEVLQEVATISELSKKYGVEELTAAQMGGLECGKCHY